MKKLTDENGVPTVAGAQAMFAAMDEAAANKAWREAETSEPAQGGEFFLPSDDGDPARTAVYFDGALVDIAIEDLTSPGGRPLASPNNAVTRVCIAKHEAAWLRDVLIALDLGPACAPVHEGDR